jgi:hypothetical protein
MGDTYLLLTPLLMLGVLALVRFVGCQLVFPLSNPRLPPPENVTATPGNQGVTIAWDPVEDADNYIVARGETSGGPYLNERTVSSAETSVTEEPLTNGTTYFFVVATKRGAAIGEPSTEVSATPAQALVTFKTPGTIRNDFTGPVGMVIQIAGTPVTAIGLGRIVVSGNSGTHALTIADSVTGFTIPGASATVDLAATAAAPNAFAYAIFPGPIVLNANTEYYILTQETAGGDQWFDLDTTVLTSNVASVTSAVFGDGITPFVRGGGAGHSYGPVDLLFS